MSDLSFLDWPFLEPRHRELALALDAWAAEALAEGRIDHHDTDNACRTLVRLLGDGGWLTHAARDPDDGASKLDVRALCLIRETLARHDALADFAFSATYKWLLGITGTAIAYWNRARQPGWAPATAGWFNVSSMARPDYAAGLTLRDDALRFTRGNPSHAGLYVLASALDYLAQHSGLAAHVQRLTTALHAGLAEAG